MRRKESLSDYRRRLIPALELMEARLEQPFSLEDAAWNCCLSPYHFHRIFTAVVGSTPGAYVRERRLSVAARELLQGRRKVSELAFELGYGSPEAFARAFQAHFHLCPGEYRERALPVFLRGNELECPESVAQSRPQEIGTPGFRATTRLVGLFRTGVNDHPANMRRLYAFLERRPSATPLEWTIADRHVPSPEGERYEFFVGQEVDSLTDLPPGLEALEIPSRPEVEVRSLATVAELHGQIPDTTRRELETSGLEAAPGEWKLESSSGPVRWGRIGWSHRIPVIEA